MTSLFLHAEAVSARQQPAGTDDPFADAIRALDLTRCHTVEFCVALLDGEATSKVSHYVSSWPDVVCTAMRRETARFLRAHADAVIVCQTTAMAEHLGKKCCVLILHYRDKPAV